MFAIFLVLYRLRPRRPSCAEEFLCELEAAEVRYTQKLSKEVKATREIADSAMMR